MEAKVITDVVPKRLLNEVKEWGRTSSAKGERGFRRAPKSEDSLTGSWGEAIASEWSGRRDLDGYVWRWRVEWRKFSSGNQKSSEEGALGADGIFQIEVDKFRVGVSPAGDDKFSMENIEVQSSFKKGLLFQAKRADAKEGPERLFEQCQDMERVVPGGGAFFEYGNEEYRAALAKEVIVAEGIGKHIERIKRLGDFLSDEFLECKVGIEGLYVDFDDETLYFPNEDDQIEVVKSKIGNGIRVKVRAFKPVDASDIA